MSMNIYTDNEIEIDGVKTGLKVTQTGKGTIVYTPERFDFSKNIWVDSYKEHPMPHKRYSLAHDSPASGAAGRAQFEADIRSLMIALNGSL